MMEFALKMGKKKIDTKEFELPETVFIRDIENKVFQSITLQCLSQIEGIRLIEGNFIDHLFGRSAEGVQGICAEQDEKSQSVKIRVEVPVFFSHFRILELAADRTAGRRVTDLKTGILECFPRIYLYPSMASGFHLRGEGKPAGLVMALNSPGF